jgi:organic radical activating enzyme
MKKIIRIQQDDDSLLHLTWLINNICTNACSYCPKDLHAGKNHNYDWEKARVFFKMLFERYPKIHCSVSGGEPSISPFFREIVETFHNAGHTIGVTSNAAKPVRYWAEIAPFLSYICFSYHPENPDPQFKQKVSAVCMNTLTTVRIMMHPEYWDHCVEVHDSFKDNEFVFVEPVRILNWWGMNNIHLTQYTDEQLEWFYNNSRDNKLLTHMLPSKPVARINSTIHFDDGTIDEQPNTVEYINSGMTNFFGYTCEIGLKELKVNWMGDVTLGNCDDNVIGYIGDPDNIKWPKSSVVCDKTICQCTSSVNINKWIENE